MEIENAEAYPIESCLAHMDQLSSMLGARICDQTLVTDKPLDYYGLRTEEKKS